MPPLVDRVVNPNTDEKDAEPLVRTARTGVRLWLLLLLLLLLVLFRLVDDLILILSLPMLMIDLFSLGGSFAEK